MKDRAPRETNQQAGLLSKREPHTRKRTHTPTRTDTREKKDKQKRARGRFGTCDSHKLIARSTLMDGSGRETITKRSSRPRISILRADLGWCTGFATPPSIIIQRLRRCWKTQTRRCETASKESAVNNYRVFPRRDGRKASTLAMDGQRANE